MMMKKKLVVLLATMAMLLVAFAAPAVADNDRHDNRWFDIRLNDDHHEDYCWAYSRVFEEWQWECD